jgi:hypothetical protein
MWRSCAWLACILLCATVATAENMCWPAADCTTCNACCRPHLAAGEPCKECVVKECLPIPFTGATVVINTSKCAPTCSSGSSYGYDERAVRMVQILAGNGSSVRPGDAYFLRAADVYDFTTAEGGSNGVAARILVDITGPNCPMFVATWTLSAYLDGDGVLQAASVFEVPPPYLDNPYPYLCEPTIARNLGPTDHPVLEVNFLPKPSPVALPPTVLVQE